MLSLSVVIITLNEEPNIGRCLDSVANIADELIVVDSGSTDNTEEICISRGARFVHQDFLGYVEQKNYANSLASYDYILSLDADEALSAVLEQSIQEVKKDWKHAAYSFNRLTNYCGRWIKHCGWYPDKKVRLFDRRKGRWEGVLIHESFVIDKAETAGHLEGDLYHYSYYSIEEHISQANKFSSIGAREIFDGGRRPPFCKLLLSPVLKFIKDYFIKAGFLDGYYGYVICRISAHATFLKYAKLKQLYKANKKR